MAGAVAALTLPLGAEAAARPLHPAAHVRLPATAEAAEPYVPQDSCDPTAKPGVIAFRDLMLATYKRGRDGGIVLACNSGGLSEHKEGRAWDWMLDAHVYADAYVATEAVDWLIAPGPHGEPGWNARRFGIMYIIWNRRIWGAYRASEGWRPYVGVSAHTDHVHFSFGWNGAMKRTSWWTGKVAPVDYGPCATFVGQLAPAYSRPRLTPCGPVTTAPVTDQIFAHRGDSGAHVLALQKALRIRPLSGFYGAETAVVVASWQRNHHLPATGVVDLRTAMAMGLVARPVPPFAKPGDDSSRVRAIQRILGIRPASGFYGTVTTHTVAVWQRNHHLPISGVITVQTAIAMGFLPRPAVPPFAKPGDHGSHVLLVQRVLHVRPVSGFYGEVTTRTVAAWQRRHHLHPTGIVDHVTFAAMHL